MLNNKEKNHVLTEEEKRSAKLNRETKILEILALTCTILVCILVFVNPPFIPVFVKIMLLPVPFVLLAIAYPSQYG